MAVTIDAFDQLIELMSDGTIDMDDGAADVFKAILSTGYTFTATHTALTDVNGAEVAATNGYATGGKSLTSVTWAQSSGNVVWSSGVVRWDASGGSITALDSVIYDETATTPAPIDAVMIAIDFGATASAGDGTPFLITPDATDGWFSGDFTGA